MKIYFLIGIVFVSAFFLIRMNRMRILKWLLKLRAGLQLQSLRTAIKDADQDKEKTDRKNMVVFNTVSGKFEPVQKKVLKYVEQKQKRKNNAAKTPFRRKFTPGRKKILHQSVQEAEKKSLYVTN